MCQIDEQEGTDSFAAICRFLRELFSKNHGGIYPEKLVSIHAQVYVKQ